MSNYDPKADERRQRLIVAQSSLDRAVCILGPIKPGESWKDYISWVTSKADEIYDWVFSKGDNTHATSANINNDSSNSKSGPVPTLKQKEWLDKIETKHGFTKEQIIEKYKRYPSTKDEAIECVKIMKGQV